MAIRSSNRVEHEVSTKKEGSETRTREDVEASASSNQRRRSTQVSGVTSVRRRGVSTAIRNAAAAKDKNFIETIGVKRWVAF